VKLTSVTTKKRQIKDFADLRGVFAKSGVKYNKKAARKAYIKDIVADYIKKKERIEKN